MELLSLNSVQNVQRLYVDCSSVTLDIDCSTDIYQPLSIDCSMTYSLDMNLFVGDVNQPALMLPWQQQSADQEYISLPWQQQLTQEQTEMVDIIGENYMHDLHVYYCHPNFNKPVKKTICYMSYH